MKIMLFNSYKGGSGKTTVSANLAIELAKRTKKKVALIDWDLQGPSLHTLISTKDGPRIFDFLEQKKSLKEILQLVKLKDNIELWLATNTVDFEIIEKLTDKNIWLKVTVRLIKDFLELKKEFDYIIFDTGPGLSYHTVGLMMACNTIFFVIRPDAYDTVGLEDTLISIYSEELRKKSDINAYFIIGKIPQNFDDNRKLKIIDDLQAKYNVKFAGEISCFCDVAGTVASTFFTLDHPEHPFSQQIRKIADFIQENV